MLGRIRERAVRARRGSMAALLLFAMAGLTACGSTTGTTAGTSPGASASSPTATASGSETPSPTPASWHRIATPPFPGGLRAVWDGSEMLVVHFTASPSGERCHEDAAAYDPATDTWRTLPAVPRPRQEACYDSDGDQAVWTGKEMLLWGLTNTAYDPSTNSWRRLTAPPADGRAPQIIVWTGHQMIGWGHVDCCDIADTSGEAYTPATGSATRLPDSPLSGGGGPAAAWTGSVMIVAGGDNGEGLGIFAEAAAYRPTTRTWRTLPSMPISRAGGTALWDGNEVLIFGGWGGANTEDETDGPTRLLARGVAYDPSTNRWRWLPTPEFPRDGAVYAWDGHEVLMWGGRGLDGSVPPHGEAFDPATNTWSPLPKAPLRGRVEANSVWTGTELIIWGGFDARTATPDGTWRGLTDGAAFQPAAT